MSRYAIMKRKRGIRRAYTDGYYSTDQDYMEEQAKKLASSGEYSMVKVIDADTGRIVASFTQSER